MQCKSVVTDVACVRVCVVFEEEPNGIRVTDGHVQRGRSVPALVNETGLTSQHLPQRDDVAGRACVEEGLDRGHGIRFHGPRL
jgi:hypothetical protein